MVVTFAYVPNRGNHTDWLLHKFSKLLIAKALKVNFLRAGWVFWGAAVWNFRYFRMGAASDLYCVPMAKYLDGAGWAGGRRRRYCRPCTAP
jgi:hypothetical protein